MHVQFTYYEVMDCDVTAVDITFDGRRFRNYPQEYLDRRYGNQCETFDLPLTAEEFIAGLPPVYYEVMP